jgi:DNA polymerase-4
MTPMAGTTRTTRTTRTARTIAYAHLHRPSDETYRQLFAVLADITPTVQALPPDAALLDLTGALGYFKQTPADLALLLQVKILARFAIRTTIGIGPNRMLATLAAQTAAPAGTHILPDDPQQIAAFLDPLPLRVLPDIGPKTSHALAKYGLTTVADLRAVPVATLQRITTAGTGRLLAERAHGRDPRTVHPGGPPATLTVRRTFDRDTVDPDATRRALLSSALELGARLRSSGQVAGRLELEVRYADRSGTTRARTLREPTSHTAALQQQIYALHDSLGLQRARQRSLTVRAQGLSPVECAAVQLTFDRRTELRRRLDPVMDRATTRFGPHALTRATVITDRRPPSETPVDRRAAVSGRTFRWPPA